MRRSRTPEVERSKASIAHISETTGLIHSKQKPKCTAIANAFPLMCLFLEFIIYLKVPQRSKVKSTFQKNIGFLSTSHTKTMLILFLVRYTVFDIFAILCFYDPTHLFQAWRIWLDIRWWRGDFINVIQIALNDYSQPRDCPSGNDALVSKLRSSVRISMSIMLTISVDN